MHLDPEPVTERPRRRGLVLGALVAAGFLGASVFAVLQPAGADEGPEIALKSGDKKVIVSDRPMSSTGLGTANGPAAPTDCVEDPVIASACDLYRLKIDLETSEDALNFVSLRVDFDTPTVPSLTAVAAGFTSINAGDLDIGVWDVSGEKPVRMAVAGAGEPYAVPEIASFEPTLPEYLVTIESARAPLLGYTLTASFSNELFDSPFEALDPAFGGAEDLSVRPLDDSAERPSVAAPVVEAPYSFEDVTPPPSFVGSQILAPAPVIADSDFAGFRGVVDDALAPATLDAETASVVVPTPKDPSVPMLLFWLLVVPMLLLAFVAAVIRRRRPTALQG